jgi:hypothetical protein
MGPRTSTSIVILALLAIVLAYTVGHNTGGTKGTSIAVGVTTVECKILTPVHKELRSQHFTVDRGDGKSVTISGLVFTACVDPNLYVTQQTLDMIYENVKERLYHINDAIPFKTALEVKTAAAAEAYRIIQEFSSYKGRIVVYVGTQPETTERVVSKTVIPSRL